jgi:cysteine desulfurase
MARRPGTENVAGIVGFGLAAEQAAADLDGGGDLAAMRDETARRLKEISAEAEVFGVGAGRLPNTLCVTMPGVPSETQVMAFDLAGIAVSAGAACSSGKVRALHVLRAMGIPEEVATTAIRVSLGWQTAPDDLDRFVRAWADVYFRARVNLKTSESAA